MLTAVSIAAGVFFILFVVFFYLWLKARMDDRFDDVHTFIAGVERDTFSEITRSAEALDRRISTLEAEAGVETPPRRRR